MKSRAHFGSPRTRLAQRAAFAALFAALPITLAGSLTVGCRSCVDRTFAAAGASSLLGFAGASPTDELPRLSVIVENGAYDGACVYTVRYEDSLTIFTNELVCHAHEADCYCQPQDPATLFRATGAKVILLSPFLNQANKLDTVYLTQEEDSCGEIPSRVVFRQPPISEFVSKPCEAARDQLLACGESWLGEDLNCAIGGASKEQLSEGDALYTCLAQASCADYDQTLCEQREANTPPSPLIQCITKSLPAQDAEDLAAHAAAFCP